MTSTNNDIILLPKNGHAYTFNCPYSTTCVSWESASIVMIKLTRWVATAKLPTKLHTSFDKLPLLHTLITNDLREGGKEGGREGGGDGGR